MHTGEAALKHRRLAGKEGLFVDLMHLTALLGKCILTCSLDQSKRHALR